MPMQHHRAAWLPPSVASMSSVASSLQPPAFGPVLHWGTVKGGKYIAVRKSLVTLVPLDVPFPPRTRTTFPRPSAMGRPARSQCRATSLPLPAPRPPRVLPARPSLFYRAPHAPASAPRSRPMLTLLPLSTPLPSKSGAWRSRAPSPRHTGTPLSLSSLSPVFSPGAPSPGGGAPSVMIRAADDRYFGGRHE